MKAPENREFGENPAENNKMAEDQNDGTNNTKTSRKTAEKSSAGILFRKPSRTRITIGLASLALLIAGAVIYVDPFLIGSKRETQPAPSKATEPTPPLQTVQNQVESAKPLSQSENYLIKIDVN